MFNTDRNSKGIKDRNKTRGLDIYGNRENEQHTTLKKEKKNFLENFIPFLQNRDDRHMSYNATADDNNDI